METNDNEFDDTFRKNIVRAYRTNKTNKIEVVYPTSVSDYNLLVGHSYTMVQLKTIAKQFSLKQVGTKVELTKRIYDYMYYYSFASKIQRTFKKYISRQYLGFIRFRETVNENDFLTMERMIDLPKTQFFSFKDSDGFIYGFDSMSFYQLIYVNKILTNPYTRQDFQPEIIRHFCKLIKYASFLKVPLNIIMEKDAVTPEQEQELKVVELFQKMNSLGNYADSNWFMQLDNVKLIRYLKELRDIWNYRAQLTDAVKRTICPPYGNPFRNVHYMRINYDSDLYTLRQELIHVLEIFINSGIDKDSQTLGSYYALSALTLVSYNASIALPWLYQSVQYY
jgi:hypothetical protein